MAIGLHLRKRLAARFMSSGSNWYESSVSSYKRRLFGDLHGDVLEIGPGGGVNLAYYPRHIHWIGIEPNPYMHPYLKAEAARLSLSADLELRTGIAEQLNAPDASADAVVSTLVLCSVRDPNAALREVLRVLKPGGRFVFIEHVAAPRGSGLRRTQNMIRPVWQFTADGCQPNRETWTAIENAGFAQVTYERFKMAMPIVGPHIAGFAVKAG